MTTTQEALNKAGLAAQKIMDDLSDRNGVLDGIDEDTLADIFATMRAIIAANFSLQASAEAQPSAPVAQENWITREHAMQMVATGLPTADLIKQAFGMGAALRLDNFSPDNLLRIAQSENLTAMRNALSNVSRALKTAPQVEAKEGWKLVPVEPTWTMVVAGKMEANRHRFGDDMIACVYKHMLAAAPSSQKEGGC